MSLRRRSTFKEENYSEEEGSGPEEGTERDDWLLARIRSLEELEAELETAEENRALALEKERIAAQELSTLPLCDGLVTPDPCEDAERTDTADANPEGEGSITNPLRLPEHQEKRQRLRASLPVQERSAKVNRERGAQGAGDVRGDDGGIANLREHDQEHSRIKELSECGPEGSKAPLAVREAPCKLTSHASGEAWPFQVHPTCWEGRGAGGWEEAVRQNQQRQ
ncbi:hypothetical protein NDU88_007309 [Pleurodeles waltl]|uniref:Uncharacterized protein n=1 Tax=Pleurodeles waltl TaxID=8319 RepID=A0AAV7SS89_PLEWA|nr:hypothetical protein NDU88_007309 [Pleurodeles waltl]